MLALLNKGADINFPDRDGDTALIISAGRSDIAAVTLLLASGANLLHFSNRNVNALIAAYSNQREECLREPIAAYSSVLMCLNMIKMKSKTDLSALVQLAARGDPR